MAENCWQAMDCGMQPGGENSQALGMVCPACKTKQLHGINRGVNGGRSCWVIEGTLCGEEIQGSFVEKLATCRGCDFHSRVRREEGSAYVSSTELLNKYRTV